MNMERLVLDVIIVLAVLGAYWFTIVMLDKKGLLERYDIRAYGPILMVGTKRGQKLLDFLARPKRFWRLFASAGGPLMLMTLVLIFAMLLYANYVMLAHVPYSFILPEPKGVLLLPDINELVPLVWILIGLMLATIVHESSHAILSRVEGIRVKSMGVVLALIPIAFFTKLDGGRLSGAERGKRIRILTAGVMANFVVALVSFALFFTALSVISPVGDVMITGVASESPADLAGIEEGGILTRLNEQNITTIHDVHAFMRSIPPGDIVTAHVMANGTERVFDVRMDQIGHIEIVGTTEGYPAREAGITAGMHIIQIDDTAVNTVDGFLRFMNGTKPGQMVDVRVMDNRAEKIFNITLTEPPHEDMDNGWLGVTVAPSICLGVQLKEYPASDTLRFLKAVPHKLNEPMGWTILITLPFMDFVGLMGFSGFTDFLMQFYQPVGWALPMGDGIFWMANMLFWVAWINFYVGILNCLPAVPLDGGHVFREMIVSRTGRIIKTEEKREKISHAIVTGLALLVLSSLIFLLMGPYLLRGFI